MLKKTSLILLSLSLLLCLAIPTAAAEPPMSDEAFGSLLDYYKLNTFTVGITGFRRYGTSGSNGTISSHTSPNGNKFSTISYGSVAAASVEDYNVALKTLVAGTKYYYVSDHPDLIFGIAYYGTAAGTVNRNYGSLAKSNLGNGLYLYTFIPDRADCAIFPRHSFGLSPVAFHFAKVDSVPVDPPPDLGEYISDGFASGLSATGQVLGFITSEALLPYLGLIIGISVLSAVLVYIKWLL